VTLGVYRQNSGVKPEMVMLRLKVRGGQFLHSSRSAERVNRLLDGPSGVLRRHRVAELREYLYPPPGVNCIPFEPLHRSKNTDISSWMGTWKDN
jgi:hypothetical protein